MDGRNQVASADPRYKYTGKERDAETGYDDPPIRWRTSLRNARLWGEVL